MPGVTTTTTVLTGSSTPAAVPGVTYFVPGITERGPVGTAVKVRSMAEYAATFGDRQAYCTLYDDLMTHFQEQGVEAVVSRVVGPAAAAGTLTLQDRTAVTPADTLKIDAKYPGSYSTRLSVSVADGTVASTFTIKVLQDGQLMEAFPNLASPAAAETALSASQYVVATDLASASAAPANNPAVVAATPLSAGADDRATLVAADYVTALGNFGDKWGSGIVAIPTFTASQVGAGILAHCQQFDRIGITAVAPGSTAANAKSAAGSLIPAGPGGEYMGLVFPSIVVPNGAGGKRTIGPEGYVAACRARVMQANKHPNAAPAGDVAQAKYVLDLDVDLDRADGDDLDQAQVSAIRKIGGVIELYGWRALCQSADLADYPLLSYRDLLNFVQVAADAAIEHFVFKNVDAGGQQIKAMQGVLVGVMDPIAQLGALYPRMDPSGSGSVLDPGYSVDTGATINTLQLLQQQKLAAVLSLRPAPTATDLSLTIVKAALTAAL